MQAVTFLLAFLALLTNAVATTTATSMAPTTGSVDLALPTQISARLDPAWIESECKSKNYGVHSAVYTRCPGDPDDKLFLPSAWSRANASGDPNPGADCCVRSWTIAIEAENCADQGSDTNQAGDKRDFVTVDECRKRLFWMCLFGDSFGGGARQYGSMGCQMWIIPQWQGKGHGNPEVLDWDYDKFCFPWNANGVNVNHGHGTC